MKKKEEMFVFLYLFVMLDVILDGGLCFHVLLTFFMIFKSLFLLCSYIFVSPNTKNPTKYNCLASNCICST